MNSLYPYENEREHQDTLSRFSPDAPPIFEWGLLLRRSIRRILGWQIPPRWAERDWHDEIRSEIMLAALEAHDKYDPSRGVPWEAFLRQRVVFAALARYRREWTYSLRISSCPQADFLTGARSQRSSEATRKKILAALKHLPSRDDNLIENLFWGRKTESELARGLGISQQAVNKRKQAILRQLERLLDAMEVELDSEL